MTWQDYGEVKGDKNHTVVGNLKILQNLWSPQLENKRDILVLLPPSYNENDKRYPVLYMHDGQNLFDQYTSYVGEWYVDESVLELSKDGVEAIVVGIPNIGIKRLDEYSPFIHEDYGGGQGDDYLTFIVETIKPCIDNDFRTMSDKKYTGIMGSSMGGLISLYAFFRYPKVFGFTGVMSPSLWFANQAIISYIQNVSYASGKIYLDCGTQEYRNWGSFIKNVRSENYVNKLEETCGILREKGYADGKTLLFIVDEGAGHSESAWASRFPDALRFFLNGHRV
ncbi:MAG: hypothetical protein B6242_00605 [Anaerolineaceae bacterium 4572_78]|nr:MAG: hypothetical protein B6242_00605 [Anaerolineaceae bacterium 4572_78]